MKKSVDGAYKKNMNLDKECFAIFKKVEKQKHSEFIRDAIKALAKERGIA